MRYSAPTPADLRRLKDSSELTGQQLADLFGLGGSHQWRKYTGGADPREMSVHMLFMAAARLELEDAAIERVLQRMRAVGAEVELEPLPVIRQPA
jgi:predicted transcriptional regulator